MTDDDRYPLPDYVWLRPTGAGDFGASRHEPTRGEGADHARRYVGFDLIERAVRKTPLADGPSGVLVRIIEEVQRGE